MDRIVKTNISIGIVSKKNEIVVRIDDGIDNNLYVIIDKVPL